MSSSDFIAFTDQQGNGYQIALLVANDDGSGAILSIDGEVLVSNGDASPTPYEITGLSSSYGNPDNVIQPGGELSAAGISFTDSNGQSYHLVAGPLLMSTLDPGVSQSLSGYDFGLPSVAPTITGVTEITTTAEAPVMPFASVQITDTNVGATEVLTITPADLSGLGTLSGNGLSGNAADGYTLSGSAASITSELDALVFTPDPGTPEDKHTTVFTLSDTSSAYGTPVTDNGTEVTDADLAVAPTINGTSATPLTTSFEAPVALFVGVSITDTNPGATDTLTITPSDPGGLGTLAGNGLSGSAATGYTLTGTGAEITGSLQGLVFTPAAGTLGGSHTTSFTLSDVSSAFATPATDSLTQVTDSDPLVPPSIGGTAAGQNTDDLNSFDPFAAVTITDTNAGQTETVTVTPSTTANGTLSDPNAATDGGTISNGVYTVSGTAAQVQAALQGVVFTPVVGEVSYGQAVTTGFTIQLQDTAGQTASDSTTSVTATATAPNTDLASFDGDNGGYPSAGLIADAAGDLFGTTDSGGTDGDGTVFEIAKTATGYASTPTTLVSFTGDNGSDLVAGLIADAAGDLFGTAEFDNTDGNGTVFEIAKTATGYASTPTTLVSFTGDNGSNPVAALIADAAGDLFGTASNGGTDGDGTVFEIVKTATGYASTPTVLVSFNGDNGAYPTAVLIADAAGDLFGTTENAGDDGDGDGNVFEIAKTAAGYASTPTTLVSFTGDNGSYPPAGLIADAAGDLFGTTNSGGTDSNGTVFEIAKTTTGYASTATTLVNFNGNDGSYLGASLIADAAGDLFGTASSGGAYGDGTVFEIAKTATGYAGTPTVLLSFDGDNGYSPYAGLIADAAGNLYGTTSGTSNSQGAVFEITNTGYIVAPTITGTSATAVTTTSEAPVTPFAHVTITDGNAGATDTLTITPSDATGLGTLTGAGLSGSAAAGYTLTGTAAVITGELEGLVFTPAAGTPDSSHTTTFTLSDVSSALATPTTDSLTSVIDTDPAVPPSIRGTATGQKTYDLNGLAPFARVTITDANPGQTETVTVTPSTTANGTLSDPNAATDGGTISNGVYTVSGTAAQVQAALRSLVFTPLVGEVSYGNAVTTGFTIHVLDTAGQSASKSTTSVTATATAPNTDLVSFNDSNGAEPAAGLITDAAGDLFSTTITGGANDDGTVFEITKTATGYASTPTTLVSFTGANGSYPEAGLIADAAGDVFGTAESGGGSGDGTVFEIAKTATGYASTPTTLVSFTGGNGSSPDAGLIADAAGDLFGTASSGGAGGKGTVFEIAKTATGYASAPTTLVSFTGDNGANPVAGLIADAAGDLFGTTQGGGASQAGTVFEIAQTPTGYASTPTILASFSAAGGVAPRAGLIADAAGDLFGTTNTRGPYGDGTVFEIAKTATGYASTPTTLLSFNGSNGYAPEAGLIADASGNLYGTALGSTTSQGLVFEITNTGYILAPTITGTSATAVTSTSEAPVTPFAHVAITDGNAGATDTLRITLAGLGTLAGSGLTGSAATFYTLTGTAAAITHELDALVFTPTAGTPNSSHTTNFTLSDVSSALATPTTDSLTKVTDTDPGLAPTISGTSATALTTTSEAPVTPFASVTIGDANAGATDTLKITLTGLGKLAGSGLTGSAATFYTLTGTAAAITSKLDALVFTPAAGTPNGSTTTTFTLSDTSSALPTPTTDSKTKVTDTDPAVAPVISGTSTGLTTTDEAALKPLSGVVIADQNAGADPSATITLTVGAAASDANGKLSGAGLTETSTAGIYTLAAASPATLQSELRALVFKPSAQEVAPGGTVTTGLTLAVSDAGKTATNATTHITATAANDAPTITGTKALQGTTDYVAIKPFVGVSVTDPDLGVRDSLTITLKNGSGTVTDANGVLSGAGLTKTGTGTYALAAATPAALSAVLDALTFTPTQHQVAAGLTVNTSFVLTASQTAGGSTVAGTDSKTSVGATALNYINGPANGHATLTGTPGQDVITAYGQDNIILGNGGPDIINAGSGAATVTLGNGNASVTLGGGANIVTGGTGNVTVTGAYGGGTAVTLGNGNDIVQVGGSGDTITLGNGTNLVSGTVGAAFITTGSGNDTITLGGSGSTVNAGGGTNVIHGGTGKDIFVLPAAALGFDTITGFTELNGDVLDLRPALAATNWNGSAATLGNYLKVTDGAGSATLAIAAAGSGAGTTIATLSGSGNLGLTDLVSHHSLLT